MNGTVAEAPGQLDPRTREHGAGDGTRARGGLAGQIHAFRPSESATTSIANRYRTPDASRSPRPGDVRGAHRVGSRNPPRLPAVTEIGLIAATAG